MSFSLSRQVCYLCIAELYYYAVKGILYIVVCSSLVTLL